MTEKASFQSDIDQLGELRVAYDRPIARSMPAWYRDVGEPETVVAPYTVACAGCGAPFLPARSWQKFHSAACRAEYHQSHGHEGVIKASGRLKTVQSIVVHLPPGAEFVPGDRVKLVRA